MVQGKRRNKVLRGFVHQVRRVRAPKRAKDLVQRKRRNKGLRESLHQVRRVGAPKRAKDLELRKGPKTWCKGNGRTGVCGSLCTKSEAAERRTTETRRRNSSTRCLLRPGTLVSRNERSRCTKCTAASSIYYAFFGVASSKAKPTPPDSASQVRQRLASPAAPRKSGSAPPSPTPTSTDLGCAP